MSTPASGQQTIASVRAEMRRPLSDAERAFYRGITDTAMTGTKFEQLYNVATAEELILAQQHGITLRALDEPGTPYLFAVGFGLVASYNAEYIVVNEAHWEGKQPVANKTRAELDARYKHMKQDRPYTTEKIEEILNKVAQYYLEWIASGYSS